MNLLLSWVSAPFGDERILYALIQIGILALYLLLAVRAWKKSPARLLELVTATIFGLLLEEGDILIWGTYHYNPNWILLDRVPIGIAMTWALIIVSALNMTDALGISDASVNLQTRGRKFFAFASLAPFADALWAILLDLALDAVAIRLGLWTWNVPSGAGWYGVPWGNFYSWLFVAFWFSFFTRLVRAKKWNRAQLAVPFVAFVFLIASIAPFQIVKAIFFPAPGEGMPLFAIAFIAFCVGVMYAVKRFPRHAREPLDGFLLGARLLVHLFFLWALLASFVFVQLPILLGVSLAMLLIEFVIVRWIQRSHFRFSASDFRLPTSHVQE